MFYRYVIAVISLCLLVSGCHQTEIGQGRHALSPAHTGPLHTGSVHPAAMQPPGAPVHAAPAPAYGAGPYRLGSGDRVRVVVFGHNNLSRTYGVDSSGFISMPLIGAVNAQGITTFELEESIAGKLRARYVKNPKVNVEVQNYRPFFILGEVRRPGQYPYVNGMTVETAAAIAGGYTERAHTGKIKLTRPYAGQEHAIMVDGRYSVQPGDTIYVNERFF